MFGFDDAAIIAAIQAAAAEQAAAAAAAAAASGAGAAGAGAMGAGLADAGLGALGTMGANGAVGLAQSPEIMSAIEAAQSAMPVGESAAAGGNALANAGTASAGMPSAMSSSQALQLGEMGATGVNQQAAGALTNAAGTNQAAAGIQSVANGTQGSFAGPATGTELPAGAQASGAYTQPVTNSAVAAQPAASETIFGLTPSQWGQQALTQGGSTILSALGNQQSQNAQSDKYKQYQSDMAVLDEQNRARTAEALANYSPDKLQVSQDQYVANQMADYDKNMMAPSTEVYGQPSASDAVSQDMAARRAAVQGYNRGQFQNSAKMRAFSNSLLGANQNLNYSGLKNSLNGGVGSLYGEAARYGMQDAAGAGGALTGAGSLLSGLGNLALANQITSGKKPSSVFDV